MTTSSVQAPEQVRTKIRPGATPAEHAVYFRRLYPNEGLGADCYPAEDASVVADAAAPAEEIRYGSSQDDDGMRALFRQIKDQLKKRRSRLRALRRELKRLRKELVAKYQRQSLKDQRVLYSHVEGYILLPADVLSVKPTSLSWGELSTTYMRPIRNWLSKYANAWLHCGRWDLTIYTRDLEKAFAERALFRAGKLDSIGAATAPIDKLRAAYMQRWVAVTPTTLRQLRDKCRGTNGEAPEEWWNDQLGFGVLLRRDKRLRKLTAKEVKKYQSQVRRFSKNRAALEAAEIFRARADALMQKSNVSVDALYEKVHELITFHQLHHIKRYPVPLDQHLAESVVGSKLANVSGVDWATRRGLMTRHSGVVGLLAVSEYYDGRRHLYGLSTFDANQRTFDYSPPYTYTLSLPSSGESNGVFLGPTSATGASLVQRLDCTPTWWQDSLDRTIASAALKLQNLRLDSGDDSFNLGRSVAELKDTPLLWKQAEEMLTFGKLSVAEFLVKVKGKKVKAAYYENLLRQARVTSIAQVPIRTMAALYLAYKFGVEPSLNDVDTLVRSTRQWVRAVRRGLVGMYRVSQEAVKSATMRTHIADASVMLNGRDVDLGSFVATSVDVNVDLPCVMTVFRSDDGLWHPSLSYGEGQYCPKLIETNRYGEWELIPNLTRCFRSDSLAFTPDERAGYVTRLLDDYVARRLNRLGQLRFRWYLARNSRVFARIHADEINKILRIEDQRNLLESGLTPKVAWELTPLSFLIDWFSNTYKIATAVTDIWQSWHDDVTFTDEGLWAVIRSEAYGKLVTPSRLDIRELQLNAGYTSRVRCADEGHLAEEYSQEITHLGASPADFQAMRSGMLTGHPMAIDPSYYNADEYPFSWDYTPRTETTTWLWYRLATARAVVRAYYDVGAVKDAVKIAHVATRLPIEVAGWRALLPRLEFHLSAGKFTSLLALLTQAARWVR